MEYRILLIESSRIMLERLSSVIRGTKGMVLAARYRSPEEALGQGGYLGVRAPGWPPLSWTGVHVA